MKTFLPSRPTTSRHNANPTNRWVQVCTFLPLILAACHGVLSSGDILPLAVEAASASSPSLSVVKSIGLHRRPLPLGLKNAPFISTKSDISWRAENLSKLIRSMRGGASDDSGSESDEESEESGDEEFDQDESESDSEEDDEEEEEGDEESDEESDEEEEDDEEEAELVVVDEEEIDTYDEDRYSDEEPETTSVSKLSKPAEDVEYDIMLTPPAMQQFSVSIGVLLLSNRIDILDQKAVRIARFAFLAYIISTQIFLIYVRIRAKKINDRTPITINNPLASLVQGSAVGGGNAIVKSLADQVLSTQTTILEYDLKEVKKMNGSLLFPMVFLYFLHFKMKQVQPLIMQTATGFLNLVYSPLFQVYVLGRNLERPFKPPTNPMLGGGMEGMKNDEDVEEGDDAQSDSSAAIGETEEEDVEAGEEVDVSSDGEGDDGESEYDSDED
mmetsp:Transcript_7853/g.16806  ORF Transcript_7853/g.16806 Transcript_7853/m.16806 type:complete len:443 (-) Transcript_7853:84-1412(-)|eukprot:CAMPEP_0171335912 /NCGR_PEP_ID=MMETSP0878-20121228/5652_1 /TAXON_ID=67004 /ORGANISM="Thalassiosira weissflogii, Strain CCMP1336" /LENGTH=442 /DNA_ID=CAMNT_0011837255 /DNA_START=41 /DNA_END=1369 /DNA_ORIENTATION=-